MDTEKPDYGLRIIVRTDQAFHGHPDPSDLQEIHSHAHGVHGMSVCRSVNTRYMREGFVVVFPTRFKLKR